MKRWMSLIVSIVLLAALFVMHGSVARDAVATLPDAALATALPPVSIQLFSNLKTPASPILTQEGYAGLESVTAYYTTSDAPELFGLTMLYGGFTPWEEDSVVIGTDLAVAVFLTEDAVGQTLAYNGRDYTVCGVYARPDSLLARVSQTPAPIVFLPLAAYPDQNAVAGEILMSCAGAPSTESVAAVLEAQFNVRLTVYSAYHFGETRRLAQQSASLLWLLSALTFWGLSVWWGIQRVLRLINALKADAIRTTPVGHRRELVLCVVALACFAAGTVWLCCSGFVLFLPQDLITRDGSVIEYIIGNFQLENLRMDQFLCAFSTRVKTVLTLLVLCAAVVLWRIAYQMKTILKGL